MYIVEIGLILGDEPLLESKYYRDQENLNEETKKRLFSAMQNLVGEIFNDQLETVKIEEYAILFHYLFLEGKGGSKTRSPPLHVYTIIDTDGESVPNIVENTLKSKMVSVSKEFADSYRKSGEVYLREFDALSFSKNVVEKVFKDLIGTPVDRFDALFTNQ